MRKFLKVGIICYPTIGGSGIVATALGQLLAEAGHEVHFISYERPVRLNLDLPNLYFHAVKVNEYPLFKYPDYTLPLSVRIMEVCQEFGLDLLHVHYAVPHATAALLATLMMPSSKRPAILTTLHGTDTNLLGNDPHYRPIIKYSMEHSTGITTVSESLKKQTIETFGVKHVIEVIPNFFDPKPSGRSRAEIRSTLGIAATDVVFLHMSNLRPVKRLGDILKAFAQLRNQKHAKLLVLAGGDFEPYREQVRQLALGDRVIVREEEWAVAGYIEASDIGIYASEQESFGLGILETLAFGKPVIGTTAGGIPEVIKNGKTGFLVGVGQIGQMATLMDRLIEDSALRQKAGWAAKKDAHQRFSSQAILARYVALYRKLLAIK